MNEKVIPALQQPDDQACPGMSVLVYFSSLPIDTPRYFFQHSHSCELRKPSITTNH